MNIPVITIGLTLVVTSLTGCEKTPTSQPSSAVKTASAHKSPSPPVKGAPQNGGKDKNDSVFSPTKAELDKALSLIRDMRDRKTCNRVMGCRASIALAGLGRATEAAIIQVLAKDKGSDGYWVIRCIDLLGQLGRTDSAAFLVTLLDDKRTEIRTRAAMALARMAAPSTRESVQAAYDLAEDGPDLGFKIALLYAIDRIGPFSVERRKMVAGLLPQDKAGLGRISPLHLITAAEVAKEWPIPEALPSLRITAAHIGPFIRRNSIDALGRLKDTGAIPVLIGRMKDDVPSIRKAAMNALRAITGNDLPRSEEDWIAWCEKRQCR